MIRHHRLRFVWSALALPIALYLVLVLWPNIQAFWLSLTRWNGFTANPTFIGLANYQRLLTDPVVALSLRNNLIAVVVMTTITLALALFFATMINVGSQRRIAGIRGASFYRVLFFVPQVLSLAVLGVLWMFLYDPTANGLLNTPLSWLGIRPVDWLGQPDTAFGSILAVAVWGSVGFYVVLFISAIGSIPTELYEAARIDGASRWAAFWQITLPLIWPIVQVGAIYLGMGALDMFVLVNTMSAAGGSGGPDGATQVLGNLLIITAFTDNQFGYAATIGVALFVLTLVFAAATFIASRRDRVEFG